MIDKKYHTKLSKFMSLVLRHKPEEIGIVLDANGWTAVNDLMAGMNSYGKEIDFETLELIVRTNSKQRFAFNGDKSMIRANQGHSIGVDLGFTPKNPPAILYHGTGAGFVGSIYKAGIRKMKRDHVHLSPDVETAVSVGQRHGKPVVFEILTADMVNDGFSFYEAENGVWLTAEVPVKYIRKIEL